LDSGNALRKVVHSRFQPDLFAIDGHGHHRTAHGLTNWIARLVQFQ
jgi:hypothetical protein